MATPKKNGVHHLEGQTELFGGLRSILQGKTSSDDANRKAVDSIRESYPLIAEILGGMKAEKGQPEVLPGTLNFYVRDGVVKFSINVKSEKTTLFGDLADIAKPFDSIECALAAGKFASKPYSEQKGSYTPEQEAALI